MAVGYPLAGANGTVVTYKNQSGTWIREISLFGVLPGGSFGASIDMTDEVLLVGAPLILFPGSNTKVGAVYVYDNHGILGRSNVWVANRNGTLWGDDRKLAADEEFGSAVSISSNKRVIVVGAPKSSMGNLAHRGRVYVFERNRNDTEWGRMGDFFGLLDENNFGAVVDVSADGSHFIVGAPGGEYGYFSIYIWTDPGWRMVAMIRGSNSGEKCGGFVKMLTPDGSIAAVGSPFFDFDKGKVVIYIDIEGRYRQLGQPIIGATGDYLGTNNVFPIGKDSLAIGTNTSMVRIFKYHSNIENWLEAREPFEMKNIYSEISASTISYFFDDANDKNL